MIQSPRDTLRPRRAAGVGLGLLLAATLSGAADATPADREIAQLLAFVEASPCQVVRNGSAHGAAEGRAHMERKLAWLRKRGRVSSAEDFIRLAATESSTTGRAYAVRCPGEPEQPSADWLAAELARLRQAAAAEPGPTASR